MVVGHWAGGRVGTKVKVVDEKEQSKTEQIELEFDLNKVCI